MTPHSKKIGRETALLYGAWTILLLSILTMVIPTSNPHSFSEFEVREGVDVQVKSDDRPSHLIPNNLTP